jgi:cation diffusion facilitator CzcD-associated flavoprotein CzcO
MQPEINEYFEDVAKHYQLYQHIRFETIVLSAKWDEVEGCWIVILQDAKTKSVSTRRCKILVSAVGALSVLSCGLGTSE